MLWRFIIRTTRLLLNYSKQWGYSCIASQWSMWEGRSLINLFLTQRKIPGKPEGEAEVSIFLCFSASSSAVWKKIVLHVISDDIRKSQPGKITPVLGTNHLQSKSYFVPLSWLPLVAWALTGEKSRIILIAWCFQDVFWDKNVSWALFNLWSRIWSSMWDQVIAWSKRIYTESAVAKTLISKATCCCSPSLQP